ncbi:MAG: RraA family protein [Methanospirillum sp.]|nr:RraA family protein [Methanospirillum sp.]
MLDSIIQYIRVNRVSTTEIADAMGKTGDIPGVRPITAQMHCVGKTRWIYAYAESNWDFHVQIRDISPGEIVFVETFDCNNRAIFGSLVSKYLLLYREAAAIVIRGYVRDVHTLIKEKYQIWTEGVTPIGCFNRQAAYSFDEQIISEKRALYDGSIGVCDDSGVIIIPKELHTEAFLQSLMKMEEQEDIWFDCIDRKKWNTYETVCLKKYLVP